MCRHYNSIDLENDTAYVVCGSIEREKLRNSSFISRLSTRRKDRATAASSGTLTQSSPLQYQTQHHPHVIQRASSVATDDGTNNDSNISGCIRRVTHHGIAADFLSLSRRDFGKDNDGSFNTEKMPHLKAENIDVYF